MRSTNAEAATATVPSDAVVSFYSVQLFCAIMSTSIQLIAQTECATTKHLNIFIKFSNSLDQSQ